ncbi:ribosome biogenesis/translation initiation ATPase RLI [Candidatus Woesearchaeota archaeon]|nr:ribosome biogenesis/translation initiation ATPase RLI [Candidatus Woesearchaeota archaeon]
MARIAVVEKDKCNPEGCGNYLCIRVCPVNRIGKDCIIKGLSTKAQIDEELCTGCGICVNRCPFGAIHIINLPEELKEGPIHRYGKNGFSLYRLPIPIFGKVVGILGVNGIGKTTALKILAGLLKPNFGKEKEAAYDELIDHFKGSEAQSFFEKIKKGHIKISYKPQQVDAIPKTAKGKVIDLLKKVDEKKELSKVAKQLEIEKILDNNINEISGGELQRVAIAATVLKKANLYVFDEPSSYLDIKQRIKVSKFIKNLADENTAVMVVEHDLIILDYMTDLIHMMYGKESVYGVVSQPKAARNGINIYLDGYLKEENVRFRDKTIKFSVKPPTESKKRMLLTGWQDIEKKLGSFKLKAEKGELHRHETIGILGENGIGKTTFVKILAGALKQDKGIVDQNIKVSYKPQYIETKSDELVMAALKEAMQKYDVQLMRPLNLKHLLAKKIIELSGGELQRVAIALCLSQKADLYLLDEPSAYLDIEQRLAVSKVIHDIMEERGTSALVVDHDLLFIDYLSEGLVVFAGEPAVHGEAKGPFNMKDGMNLFLRELGITLRRDKESNRPRINKEGSQLDREQKEENKLYYG